MIKKFDENKHTNINKSHLEINLNTKLLYAKAHPIKELIPPKHYK